MENPFVSRDYRLVKRRLVRLGSSDFAEFFKRLEQSELPVCHEKAVREGAFIVCHSCGFKEFA